MKSVTLLCTGLVGGLLAVPPAAAAQTRPPPPAAARPAPAATAPTVTLSGYLRDAATGEALIGATVFVKRPGLGATADERGFYPLAVPRGTHTFTFTYLGYSATEQTLTLAANRTATVQLRPQAAQIGEVVVRGRAPGHNVQSTEMGVTRLDMKTIRLVPPLLGEVDVVRTLLLLPGISTVGEGAAGFNVRGGGIDQNLILLDDAPVMSGSHLFGLFSVFNPDAVSDVKLVKGGIPAQYGGRLSSPLDVRLKNGNSERLRATGGLALEFAKHLLALGNTVLITGRDQAKLDQARQQLPGVHTFQRDVSDPAAIRQLYTDVTARFPALNVLINNAGEMRKLDLNDPALDLLDVTREIDVNLSGPIRMVQQFLPYLKRQPAAAIINVTSGLALVPFPISPVYGATKSGLRSYTKSLRVQLQPTAVRVFELVAPGAKTPLNDKFATDVKESDLMAPDKLIAQAIKGMQHDAWEIYPGLAGALRYLSRLAPGLLLKQLSKGVPESLARLRSEAPAN